jgi:hypothetical protein
LIGAATGPHDVPGWSAAWAALPAPAAIRSTASRQAETGAAGPLKKRQIPPCLSIRLPDPIRWLRSELAVMAFQPTTRDAPSLHRVRAMRSWQLRLCQDQQGQRMPRQRETATRGARRSSIVVPGTAASSAPRRRTRLFRLDRVNLHFKQEIVAANVIFHHHRRDPR